MVLNTIQFLNNMSNTILYKCPRCQNKYFLNVLTHVQIVGEYDKYYGLTIYTKDTYSLKSVDGKIENDKLLESETLNTREGDRNETCEDYILCPECCEEIDPDTFEEINNTFCSL